MLKKIVKSPYLNLLSGLVLLLTSGLEIWENLEEFHLETHHGIFFFAIVQIIKTFPEIMHGFEAIEDAEELAK